MNPEDQSGKKSRGLVCAVLGIAGSLFLEGCRRAPAFNILGSYFPGWIVCIVGGILLTVALRYLLLNLGWETKLFALPVLYVSLAIFFGCLFWLLFFD